MALSAKHLKHAYITELIIALSVDNERGLEYAFYQFWLLINSWV
jgi:hypothetical protein